MVADSGAAHSSPSVPCDDEAPGSTPGSTTARGPTTARGIERPALARGGRRQHKNVPCVLLFPALGFCSNFAPKGAQPDVPISLRRVLNRKTYTFGSEAAMTTQLAVCEPRAGAHAEPALRPGVEEPLRGGWRRATLRDAQGSQGGRGPTGAAGRGPKRAAEANGQVRRHAAARPVVGAEPVLCAHRRPLAERSSTTGPSFERILPDCGTRTVGHHRRREDGVLARVRGWSGWQVAPVATSGRKQLQEASRS